MDKTKIKLKDVRVIFWNPEDNGFGTSITIDCTNPEVEKQIVAWVKENNIGKDNPGVANIKEYTPEDGDTTKQFQFRINDHTQIAGINGLGEDNLGYGAVVDLIATAFTYNNKFTGGQDRVGQSVSAIVVKQGSGNGAGADLAELLAEAGEAGGEQESGEKNVSSIPF